MHKNKYFILVIPVMIIGIFLIYYLPANQRFYVLLIPVIFWVIFYVWIYIEKRAKNKT